MRQFSSVPDSAAALKRQEMLRDLQRVVERCNCNWPIQKFRNGDGHDPRCPAHVPLRDRNMMPIPPRKTW